MMKNKLLATLPPKEYKSLEPHLNPVTFTIGEVLFRPGENLQHAVFPTSTVISLLTELEDGGGMEVGLVGKEGMVGVSIVLGGTETKLGTAQAHGTALRIEAAKVREEFGKGGVFQSMLLRYTHTLISQISQSAVCNVRHPVEGRLARWLLMYHDRLERDEFEMTQQIMATMLGVRRSSVTEVAGKLQDMGFIQYQHGRLKITDRKGLEQFACECYPIVKEKIDELLS